MRKRFILLVLLFAVSLVSGQQTAGLPEITVESINPDGSYVLMISGRRYRAFDEKQTRVIGNLQTERNNYRNDYLECREALIRQAVGE